MGGFFSSIDREIRTENNQKSISKREISISMRLISSFVLIRQPGYADKEKNLHFREREFAWLIKIILLVLMQKERQLLYNMCLYGILHREDEANVSGLTWLLWAPELIANTEITKKIFSPLFCFRS